MLLQKYQRKVPPLKDEYSSRKTKNKNFYVKCLHTQVKKGNFRKSTFNQRKSTFNHRSIYKKIGSDIKKSISLLIKAAFKGNFLYKMFTY